MSRNKILANTNLFESIRARISFGDEVFSVAEGKRYISFEQAEYPTLESNLFMHAEIGHTFISPYFSLIKYTYDGVGVALVTNISHFIDAICSRASPGEFLLANSTLNMSFRCSTEAAKEAIISEIPNDYSGHEPRIISELYNPVYSIPLDSLQSCAYGALAKYLVKGARSFTPEKSATIDRLEELIGKSCHVNKSVCLTMLNIEKRYAFLYNYFYIESLYFSSFAKDLYDKSGSSKTPEEFFKLVESELGWRPPEQDAFERVLSDLCSENELTITYALLKDHYCDKIVSTEKARYVARKIYSMRNNIIHQRHTGEVNIDDYNTCLIALLTIIRGIKNPIKETCCVGADHTI